MKEYKFVPKENMTMDEVVAIFNEMFEYATFVFVPRGAERHFEEVDIPEPKKKSVLDGIIGFFKL